MPLITKLLAEGEDGEACRTALVAWHARSAASGARKSDEAITAEINAAYDRQRRLWQEGWK